MWKNKMSCSGESRESHVGIINDMPYILQVKSKLFYLITKPVVHVSAKKLHVVYDYLKIPQINWKE